MLVRWTVSVLAFGIIFASRGSCVDEDVDLGIDDPDPPGAERDLRRVTESEVEYVGSQLPPLYDLLIQRKLFKFCKLLKDAGIDETIAELEGTFNVFVPTDASFVFLPGGALEELQKHKHLLRSFLLYHFIKGDFPSNKIWNEMVENSVEGSPLRFNMYGGETITVSGAQILEPDLLFDRGSIYIVDRPLYPIPSQNIITYLESNYKEMYKLLVQLNLVDFISVGTFTLLVPEDEAFGYLSSDFKEALATNNSLAERIVWNHFLPGSVYLVGIDDGKQMDTVSGDVIDFTIRRGLTFANDTPIIISDIPLTNGVIHVLNRMLLPKGIETDCDCKPSSDTDNKPGSGVPGSFQPSSGGNQRPQLGQRQTTRRPGQSFQRQTPRPFGSRSTGTSIPDRATPVSFQGRPRPATSTERSANQPTRTPTPNQVTRPPFVLTGADPVFDDDINSVVEIAGENNPDQPRNPPQPPQSQRRPTPTQRATFQPTRTVATTRRPQNPIESDPNDCQTSYNPSDPRPLCQSPGTGQNCRNFGQPTYRGDRRPFCSSTTDSQSGCKDISAPFDPSDRRPTCRTTRAPVPVTRRPFQPPRQPVPPPPRQSYPPPPPRQPVPTPPPRQPLPPATEGTDTPQGCRRPGETENLHIPLCPEEPQEDCRPFLERPVAGDRRPVCKVNRQQSQIPSPHKDSERKHVKPHQQLSYPHGGQYPTQTTQPVVKQPQRGSVKTKFQTGSHHSQPQSGSYPSEPQSGRYPSHSQSGRYPHQTQSAIHPSQPQTGSHPSPQQSDSYPSSGSYPSQPHGGVQPSQPQTINPHSSRGQFQPGRPSSGYPERHPGSQTQGVSQHGSSDVRPGQPLAPQVRPGSNQGHQIGTFAQERRRPTTDASRIPITVTGTSTTPGEDSRRTLYQIVEDPALLIRGRPVKLTRTFSLFHKAGLEDILLSPGPTTVFLPSDDAFAALPKGVVDQLEENPELLRQVLSYHVTNSEILPNTQDESYTVPSLEGTQIVITMLNGGRLILVSGAKAVAVTRANNGIFYVINQLLYPLPHHDIVGAIQSRPDLSILAQLLPSSGLVDLFQGQTPYTFLAPTDNAFAQLSQDVYDELTRNTTALQEILLNHVIEGAHYGREFLTGVTFPSARGGKLRFQVVSYGYQVNDVNIKTPEIVTGTGVIHLVDQVLLEDSDLSFFNTLTNSVAGQSDSFSNTQQPAIGGQQQGPGSFTSDTVGPRSGQRNPGALHSGVSQPQVGRLQSPAGQVPGQGVSGHQPTSGSPQNTVQVSGIRSQSNVGSSGQQSHGQQIPGRPSISTTFGGRRTPTTHAAGHQPSTHGTGQQSHGQQSGHSFSGGQRTTTQGQRTQIGTFVSNRQTSTQATVSGRQPVQGTFQTGGQPNDVADLARSMGLNQFANWISNTGLLEKIHDGGVYTVFAPTDDAVNSLPQDMVHSIDSNPEQVKSIMQYHIVPQRVNLNSVTNEETASTLLQGKTIRFNVYQNSPSCHCKQLVTASGTPVGESLATMGSIQVIPVSQVLYQPTGNLLKIVEASPLLQKLNEAVKSARITWILTGSGPLTFFAPSDIAFDSLSEEQRKTLVEDKQAFSNLLKRHIVRGTFFSSGVQEDIEKRSEGGKPIKISLQEGVLTANSIPVTYADITASNGVLHVIDRFL